MNGSVVYASDETTLFSDPRSNVAEYGIGGGAAKYREIEIPKTPPEGEEMKGEVEQKGEEEDETNQYGQAIGRAEDSGQVLRSASG